MPTYGLTEVNPKHTITYDDWITLGSNYIDYELNRDNRPIFLYGLSAEVWKLMMLLSKTRKLKTLLE